MSASDVSRIGLNKRDCLRFIAHIDAIWQRRTAEAEANPPPRPKLRRKPATRKVSAPMVVCPFCELRVEDKAGVLRSHEAACKRLFAR